MIDLFIFLFFAWHALFVLISTYFCFKYVGEPPDNASQIEIDENMLPPIDGKYPYNQKLVTHYYYHSESRQTRSTVKQRDWFLADVGIDCKAS